MVCRLTPRRLLLVVIAVAPVAVALAEAPPPAQPFTFPGGHPGGFFPQGMPDPWRMPLAVPWKLRPKDPGYFDGDEFHAGTRVEQAAPVATGTHQGAPVDVELNVRQQVNLLTDPGVSPSLRAVTAAGLRTAEVTALLELSAKIGAVGEVDPVDGIPSARTVPWYRPTAGQKRLTAGGLAEQVAYELVAPTTRSPYERRLKTGDARLFVVAHWGRFAEKRRGWSLERVRAEVAVAIDRYRQTGGHAPVLQ